jgi:non-ribosomal peptide synthetase component F
MQVLLRDLFAIYQEEAYGVNAPLKQTLRQFTDYAQRQRDMQLQWMDRHAERVRELNRLGRLRWPTDLSSDEGTCAGWDALVFEIEPQLRVRLREWSRMQRTTPVIAVLAVYSAVLLRTCGREEGLIQFQSDGRSTPEVQDALGYFANALYLRLKVNPTDCFIDLLDRLKEEICAAHEQADGSLLAAQRPRPPYARGPLFNWIPEEARSLSLRAEDHTLLIESVAFEHPMIRTLDLDHEPMMLFYESPETLTGNILFPVQRHSRHSMERFADTFAAQLRRMLCEPGCSVMAFSREA